MNNNIIKMAAVGIVGYLVGFYEWKYKTQKVMLQAIIDKEDEKEDAQ